MNNFVRIASKCSFLLAKTEWV